MECEACDGDGSLMYYLAKKRCVELGGRRIDLPDGSWTYEVGGKEIELKTIGGPCPACKGSKDA
jgi:hypothetical protein